MQRLIAAAALLGLVLTSSAFAQVNSAIGGTVQDSSQALIPGVEITATNTQTGVVATTITNEAGVYNFAALIPGVYRVTASLAGFRPYTYNDVRLSAAAPIRLNFTLEVGAVTQSVEITVSSDALLKESSASIGEVLPESRVSALPIVGNNVLDLVRILPGYRESTGGNALDTFAGAPASTLNTVRDGISVSDGRFNNGLFATTTINPDMVGEVRLILTPVDAEMGRGNAQVQITTRSGTNRYGGSAVWNVRNSALDPNTWANNREIDPATGRPPQRDWINDHEYSISFGGPIIRNKTFFYSLWDQRIRKERETVNGIVLTDAARLGIFRFYDGWNPGNADAVEALTFPNNSPTRIARAVDAFGNPIPPRFNFDGSPYSGAGLQCLSVFGRLRLDGSGNMVPFTAQDCPGGTAIFPGGSATAWDSNRPVLDPTGHVWVAALKDMPHANWFGANGTTDGLNTATIRFLRTSKSGGNTFGTSPNDNRKQFNIKIDHHFSPQHKISASYTLERNAFASDLSNWPNGISGDGIRRPHVVSVNFTSTLGPTLVNEARLGFRGNYNQVRRPFETEEGAVLLDLVNSIKGGPDPGYTRNVGAIYPMQIEPTGGGNYGFGQANALYNRLAQHNGNTTRQFTYGDTLSWTRGEHAFKLGGEFRPQDSKGYTNAGTNPYPRLSTGAGAVPSPLRSGGSASFGPVTALQSVRNNAASLAYLLSGSVNLVTQAYWIDSVKDIQEGKWQSIVTSPDIFRTVRTNEFSAFVKDDWKITQNLTLNLGIRWEYYGAAYIEEGFTATPRDRGLGVFGVSRGPSGGVFDSWLAAGANPVFLSGYGRNEPNATALQCTQGVVQPNLPTSSCNPANITELEFVGPGSPHPERSAAPSDWNNFGPAIGFAYQVPEFVPWLGQRSTLRGGYSITYSPTRNLSTVQGGIQDMFGSAPGSTSTLSTQAQLSAQVPGYLDLRDIARIVPLRPVSPSLPGGTLPIFGTAGTRVYGFAPDYATPYVQNFNLSLTTNVRRNMTVDIRYVGTQAKKQTGDINLNLNNVYYNTEFYAALDEARRGGNPALLDQMLAGLTLGSGATIPVGNRNSSGVVVTGAAALRASTDYNEDLRDGNYLAIAAALQAPVTPTGYVNGTPNGDTPTRRLLRNGCDRIATLGSTNYVSPTGDVTPLRCFPENYFMANPQLQPATATAGAFYRTNSGFTNYHSLEAQFTLRPTLGFSAQTTYTWSKTLGAAADGNANPLNRRADYARPYSSITHDLRTNGIIELPIGPGKLFLGNSSGWLARLLERWQTSVILNLASGRPTSISALTGLTYAAGGLTAPNTVPDVVGPWDFRTGDVKWDGPNNRGTFFGDPNPFLSVEDPQCAMSRNWASAASTPIDCNLRAVARLASPGEPGAVTLDDGRTIQYLLVNPAPGKQGTLGQTTIEGPGTIRFDANLSKSFQISETKSVQIRFDATNVLNHPNPPDPTFSINSEDFGYLVGSKTGNRSFQGQVRLSF